MKRGVVLMLVFVLAVGLSACVNSTPTSISSQPPSVEDQASLVAALQAEGATVEMGDSITQDFFSVEGQTVKVNGADLQVFEYENATTMEEATSQVAPDGGSIGTSMPMWIDKPHFYKAGRIIVLYVGSDQKTLDLLNMVMGPQFAGQ